MKGKRRKKIIFLVILAVILSSGYIVHRSFYSIPAGRLDLSQTYEEMPEDSFHHYLNLPIDHNQINGDKFRAFYLLSPGFYAGKNQITFVLTDGQMELVGTRTDFSFFENILGGSAYVLIGARGHSPTFFPEVYVNGAVDIKQAMYLYNSDQQVDDIEQIRVDLQRKGLLAAESKINVFGASGAGILAQQYVSKYGQNVQRMILESTGAPDLSILFRKHYSVDLSEYNPPVDTILQKAFYKKTTNRASVCNILYQVGRSSRHPKEEQLKIAKALQGNSWLLSYKFKPVTNLSVLKYMTQTPKEIATRVRWFELVGTDLLAYDSSKGINLLYELSRAVLADMITYCQTNRYKPKEFFINRNFKGEVLIIKGTEDVVFSDFINQKLKEAYSNSRLFFFTDGHRMQNDIDLYRKLRIDFLENGFGAMSIKIRNG